MLPTFVIGLREGLEATLIVVIIATFLSAAGRRDSLRAMWTGVGVAVLFCIGFGVALQMLDENLPQQPPGAARDARSRSSPPRRSRT